MFDLIKTCDRIHQNIEKQPHRTAIVDREQILEQITASIALID